MKLKLWDHIEIDWIDSIQSMRGWCERNEFPWNDHYKALYQRTTGYFTNQTKEAISVCQSYAQDNYGQCVGMMSIPLGCIKKIRRIK